MKIWTALHGGTERDWSCWTSCLSDWLQPTMTRHANYNDDRFHMAEFTYRYETRRTGKPSAEQLQAPIALDGWIRLPSQPKLLEPLAPHDRALLHREMTDDPRKMLRGCHGDFTTVAWDSYRNQVYIANDLYGTRPIYYWISPTGELYVSNDLRALLHAEAVPFEIDLDRCLSYLTTQYSIGENSFDDSTFFQEIRKLPSASIARWEERQLQIQSYWGINDLVQLPLLQADAIPQFRERMIESVNDRLHHSKTIVEVSGGLDSANVLAAAIAGGRADKIINVNISFKGEDMVQSNDRDVVRKLYNDLGIPGIIILGDQTLQISNAELGRDPLWYLDGPDPRANVLINETYNAIANEFDTDAGLTGEGGDFLFTGERYVLDSLLRQRKFSVFKSALWSWSDRRLGKALKLGLTYGIAPLVPIVNDIMYAKLAWSDTEYPMPEYFTAKHLARESQAKQSEHTRYKESKPLASWGRRYHYDYTWPRASYLDAVGVSMQNMHPFFDKRIIELSFSVPTEQHYDIDRAKIELYYGTKMLLRKAFVDILPRYLYDRVTKTTYAHMARKSLLNERRNLLQLFDRSEDIQLHHLEVIDKQKFWDHLVSTLIRSDDSNNDLGMSYQFLRMVIDMEIWLREMAMGRHYVLERARPGNPRLLAELETVGDPGLRIGCTK
ncbi:asparagine synthase-related protein [Paenibacillus tarimensis]|uniref:asparagine synthase-related protein n=1 Tax=Paenibacillus tarimensis TaxID=416012 RepID=UPI001F35052F|nr:asparagine synthase-related protein [Paenibacillus tarimensis]MCF2942777.1 asparagine synthase-related protein [Paenibacillus tarimensis]